MLMTYDASVEAMNK